MFTLSDQQSQGVKKVSDWFRSFDFDYSKPYFSLTGYAGTGKTTILPSIVDGTNIEPDDIAFCSPTGKAAKVMTTKMKDMGIHQQAKTIHSTIYLPNRHRVQVLERQLEDRTQALMSMTGGDVHPMYEGMSHETATRKCKEEMVILNNELDQCYDKGDTTPTFSLNVESNVRYKKLIIVDEASMVDERMAEDLMSFKIPILAIGDKGQLPPVKGDWGFLGEDPDFTLTEIHRQAKDNPIIWLATLARRGEQLPLGDHGDGVQVIRRSKDDVTYDMDRDLQVICGTHKRRWKLTRKIREEAGYTCEGPQKGEPLIICKNSKKDETIINGDFVTSYDDVEKLVKGRSGFSFQIEQDNGAIKRVYAYQGLFEQHYLRKKNGSTANQREAFRTQASAENLDFAHAITCHKSQGSQWDEVALHDESAVFGDDSANWLYTGITRAAKKLTVVV